MTIETAVTIDQLNPTYPEGGSFASQLDDHLRLVKSTLKATFPNLTGPVTATQAQLNQAIPAGLISLWSGLVSAIPTGWLLCDGTAGTPNLAGRFVIGQSVAYAQGTLGGSSTSGPAGAHTPVLAISGVHDHGATTAPTILTIGQIPAHVHTLTVTTYPTTGAGHIGSGRADTPDGPVAGSITDSVGGGTGHSHGITGDSGHVHTVTPVVDHTHTIPLPPYYALAYIMKA